MIKLDVPLHFVAITPENSGDDIRVVVVAVMRIVIYLQIHTIFRRDGITTSAIC